MLKLVYTGKYQVLLIKVNYKEKDMGVKDSLTTAMVNFRLEQEHREKLKRITAFYGSTTMTKAIRKMIDDTYNAHILNQQKEGN